MRLGPVCPPGADGSLQLTHPAGHQSDGQSQSGYGCQWHLSAFSREKAPGAFPDTGGGKGSPSLEGGVPQAGTAGCHLGVPTNSLPDPGGTSGGCRSVLIFWDPALCLCQDLLVVSTLLWWAREEAESCVSALEKDGEEVESEVPVWSAPWT